MTNSNPLSYLFLLLVFASKAMAADQPAKSPIRAEVGGSIPNQLPRPKVKDLKTRVYPTIGEIKITTDQFCGDGDVATYASRNPSVAFVTNSNVSFVLGYWFGEAGSTRPLPSADNWFPLGTTSLASDNANTTTMQSLAGNSQTSIMTLTANAVRGLSKHTGFRMPAQTAAVKKDAYFGIMMCPLGVLGTNTGNIPTAATIMQALADSIPASIPNLGDNGDPVNSMQKFSLNIESNRVGIEFEQSGNISLQDDALFLMAKDLQNFNYPGNAASIDDFRQVLNQMLGVNLLNLAEAFRNKSRCAEVPGVISSSQYWWEPFPLQLACEHLAGVVATLDKLRTAESLPSEAEFIESRQNMIKQLFKAAVVQRAEQALQAQTAALRPKNRCFDPSQPYVNKVMGSLLIDVGGSASANTLNMIHPEPLFALGGDAPYRTANGNAYTVYAASGAAKPLTIERGIEAASSSLMSRSFLLNFRVRGIGCGQNWYCQIDHTRLPL